MGSDWRLRADRASARLEILLASFAILSRRFQSDPAAAVKYLTQGEAPRDEKLDAQELAAYTCVASIILNLDAAVTQD